MKPEEFERELDKGVTSPLYYFHGDEPYLIERGVKRLLEQVVEPSFRDFNFTQFYGNETNGEAIMESAQTLPMFADRRVVLVKRAGQLSTQALDLLSPYISNPSPCTCLIFQGEKIDQRRKFFVEMGKHGRLIEYRRLYENQLGPFIRQECSIVGKRIDPAAEELLLYQIGTNLQELSAQIEKLATFVGNRDVIRLDDVRDVVSDARVNSVFDLNNCLGTKDLGGALRTLHTILRDGESPLMILSMITRHFRQLWQVRELLDRRVPQGEIAKKVGLHPFFSAGIIAQAKHHDVGRMREVFESIYQADVALKTGGGKGADLMERLVMGICGQG